MADSKNSKISELIELTDPSNADFIPIVDTANQETKKISYTSLVSALNTDDDSYSKADIDALIASGMWYYADQSAFPAAASNHGRVVHSHADGSMYYAHSGAWHKIENETEAEAARLVIQNDVDQNEADADSAISLLQADVNQNEADADSAIALLQADVNQNEADADSAIALLQADVNQNEADADSAIATLQADVDQNESDADTAIATLQADVNQNEADADSAIATLQADVDQNEADADAAIATKAPIASPTFTGDVTAPRVITNEIQAYTGSPVTYDSAEHRFRDFDETPNNLMVIKKTAGVVIGKVGINHNNPKCALHVVGGHSTGGMADETLRVVGAGLFTSDNDTSLVLAMDTDNTANTSNPILKIKRDEREASTGNVEEMNIGFVGANSLYTNQTLNAGYIQVEGGRKFEVATGSTPAKRMEVSDTGVGVIGTLDVDGDVKLSDFTSTSRSTGATALNPVQNFQPATDATVTNLCVDTAGNIVRGSQEATWTLNRAQLNALTTTKVNLLSSPGSGKCIVVEDSNWLIEVDLTKTAQSTPTTLICEIVNGQSIYKVATQITAANLSNVAGFVKTSNDGAFGMYSRDVPELDRISKFNEPMTLRATGGTAGDDFPDNFVSVKIKIKYRVWDSTTF